MVFNSLIFIFMFLPLVFLGYTLLPNRTIKTVVLIICSLMFYSWGNPNSLILMLITILWNYFTGLELELYEGDKRKFIFWLGVAFHILVLVIYKYTNFFLGFTTIHIKLTLPVGLSFFTFSAISYLADVYMGKCKAQKSPLSLALYISFFGKVSMGPIVQYHNMEASLSKYKKISVLQFGEAFQKIIKGMAKKVIMADQLAIMYSSLSSNTTCLGAWLCAIAYMLQIYFDFSGYSDMAIGISRLFGLDFDENFEHPYIANSVQNFWRRWHISLSRWFRDYVYIPLGGNRVSDKTYVRNILIVWLLTGVWHGANMNFIIWGLYYGCLLLMERFVLKDKLKQIPKPIQHIYTLTLVLIGWVFFMSPDLISAFKTIFTMLGFGATGVSDKHALFALRQNFILMLIAILFSMPIFDRIDNAILHVMKQRGVLVSICFWCVLFFICLAFIVGIHFNRFCILHFRRWLLEGGCMKKYQNLVKRTITLIMPFILIFGLIVNLIFPDKELSLVENRSLQKFPEIDKASIIDGSFETKFSSWFADQFVGRNGFIHLRYGLLKLLGQRKINNIYLCGSQLIENASLPDKKQLARNLKAINTFSENHTDLKTTFLLVPNAVSVQNNRLPYLSDETNQNQIMDSIYKKLNKKINVVDVRNKLKEHRDDYIYYNSDHHWTSLGAFYAYQKLNDSASLDDYKQMVVSKNFRGTLANGTGSIGIEDTINIFVNKNLNDYYVQESDNKIEGSIYDSSYIDSENQYSVFLGGNKSIQRIEMDNDSKRHLLLFKDSYANTFVQFLMNDYRTITIVDPRYYNDNIDKVMKDDLITDVMYLYNTNTFVEDSSLADVLGE